MKEVTWYLVSEDAPVLYLDVIEGEDTLVTRIEISEEQYEALKDAGVEEV